jgi:murein tripeptide amidase MpaA
LEVKDDGVDTAELLEEHQSHRHAERFCIDTLKIIALKDILYAVLRERERERVRERERERERGERERENIKKDRGRYTYWHTANKKMNLKSKIKNIIKYSK